MEYDLKDAFSPKGHKLTHCPVCKVVLAENRLPKHLATVHDTGSSRDDLIAQADQDICPVCYRNLKKGRLAKHINKAHPDFAAGLSSTANSKNRQRVMPQQSMQNWIKANGLTCTISPTNTATKVSKRATPKPVDEHSPIGLIVIADITKNNNRWRAGNVESCSSCKRKITFLDMGGNTLKAFDIGVNKIIIGTHVCEERSESVYAYQAGIVDSNRRRH